MKISEGLAPRTVIHIRAVLRSALTQAEKWLLIPRNVAKLTDPPRKRRSVIRVFTPDQAKIFVQACQEHRLGALLCLTLALGLRFAEVLGLKWEDVDLEKATAFVQRALQRVKGEDGKTIAQLVEPKTEQGYRLLSIPATAIALLRQHRLHQNEERSLAGSRWLKTGMVFTSSIGTPLDERNVRREFYAFLKAANLPRIRVHDLRHSCATMLLAAGEHPKVVQETLGHQSVQVTLDLYSHLMPELGLKERAAARLDAILAPAENCGQNCGQSDEKVVSRLGIEPRTRRLRDGPGERNSSKDSRI
jgi:integrase